MDVFQHVHCRWSNFEMILKLHQRLKWYPLFQFQSWLRVKQNTEIIVNLFECFVSDVTSCGGTEMIQKLSHDKRKAYITLHSGVSNEKKLCVWVEDVGISHSKIPHIIAGMAANVLASLACSHRAINRSVLLASTWCSILGHSKKHSRS